MANVLKVSDRELAVADIILGGADTNVLLAIAVKMVSHFKVPLAEAMRLIGLSKATAWRHWDAAFADAPEEMPQKPEHGGRRRQHLTVEEEKAFLEEWHQKALAGQVVTVAEMKEAFEERSGRAMTDVGFYKLLRRHRWRKLKPDTKHPKADFEAQEDFKKKSVPSCGARGQSSCRAKWTWVPSDVPG